MDLAVIIVLGLSIYLSMRRGFALTTVSFFKCIVSLILGGLFCDDLAVFLMEKTPVGTAIASKIKGTLSYKWEESDIYKALPDLFKKDGGDFSLSIINNGTERITQIILSILSFLIIVIAVALVSALICRLFSKKTNRGFIGFADWFLGLVLGIFVGCFYVFLFLALILPVLGIVAPYLTEPVVNAFNNSYIAKELYDNNLLLVIFRDFLN